MQNGILTSMALKPSIEVHINSMWSTAETLVVNIGVSLNLFSKLVSIIHITRGQLTHKQTVHHLLYAVAFSAFIGTHIEIWGGEGGRWGDNIKRSITLKCYTHIFASLSVGSWESQRFLGVPELSPWVLWSSVRVCYLLSPCQTALRETLNEMFCWHHADAIVSQANILLIVQEFIIRGPTEYSLLFRVNYK